MGKIGWSPKSLSRLLGREPLLEAVAWRWVSAGGVGCLRQSSAQVSVLVGAGVSAEHSILAAALTFPSSNFAATAAANERVWSDPAFLCISKPGSLVKRLSAVA